MNIPSGHHGYQSNEHSVGDAAEVSRMIPIVATPVSFRMDGSFVGFAPAVLVTVGTANPDEVVAAYACTQKSELPHDINT